MNHLPVVRCLVDCQVHRLEGRVIVREDTAIACQLPQAHVQRLYRIRGVNHLAYLRWELKEGDDVALVAAP